MAHGRKEIAKGTFQHDIATVSLVLKDLVKVKVKFSRYRPCMAQRVGRGIALLFHDSGTRRG